MDIRLARFALWMSPPLVTIYARIVSAWCILATPGCASAGITLYRRFGEDDAQVITRAAREAALALADSAASLNRRANELIVFAADVSDDAPTLTADQVAHLVQRLALMSLLLPLEARIGCRNQNPRHDRKRRRNQRVAQGAAAAGVCARYEEGRRRS